VRLQLCESKEWLDKSQSQVQVATAQLQQQAKEIQTAQAKLEVQKQKLGQSQARLKTYQQLEEDHKRANQVLLQFSAEPADQIKEELQCLQKHSCYNLVVNLCRCTLQPESI
jgi:DNA repair ATPase RecN